MARPPNRGQRIAEKNGAEPQIRRNRSWYDPPQFPPFQ